MKFKWYNTSMNIEECMQTLKELFPKAFIVLEEINYLNSKGETNNLVRATVEINNKVKTFASMNLSYLIVKIIDEFKIDIKEDDNAI